MTVSPRRLLPLVLLTLACGEELDAPVAAPDCSRAGPILLVPGRHVGLKVQRARDTTYLALTAPDDHPTTHAGPGCGADPVLLVDGARMLPTRVALDPRDDDPSFACDLDTDRHFRLDLTGERAPELLLPHLSCHGLPTNYGALFIGGSGYLRLFSEFPDESTATHIRDQGGNDVFVLDEWVVYTHASDLHAYSFATGEITDIPGHVLGFTGAVNHIIWYDFEDLATLTLVDLRSNTSTALTTFDRDAAWNDPAYVRDLEHWNGAFDRSGEYVYHVTSGEPPRAFDLEGRSVTMPAPGQVLSVLRGGLASVTPGDGRLHFTRPHAAAATALDATLAPDATGHAFEQVGDHLELIVDGDLVRVELDGSPARKIAADVTRDRKWLADQVLLTRSDDGALERIDTATGERTTLAARVTQWLLVESDLYYLTGEGTAPADDGAWYLSAASLGLDGRAVSRADADPRPASHVLSAN